MGEGFEEAGVVRGVAHGDAEVFGKGVNTDGANDDAAGLELGEDAAGVTNAEEDEVASAGDVFDAEGVEADSELAQPGGVYGDGAGEVGVVIQRGEGGGLGDGSDVEGRAGTVEEVDEFSRPVAVADAQAGETVDFGEGATAKNFAALGDEGAEVGGLAGREEFGVGFVVAEDDVRRERAGEGEDVGGGIEGAGGVVGIGEVNDFSARGDGGAHGGEVVAVVGRWHVHFDRAGAVEKREELEEDEGMATEDHFITRAEEDVGEELHDLAGAIARDDLGWVETEVAGEAGAEVESAAVGVEVDIGNRAGGGGQGEGRWAEGVFVGGELEDGVGVEAVLAGNVRDGAAGFVNRLGEGGGAGELLEGHGQGASIERKFKIQNLKWKIVEDEKWVVNGEKGKWTRGIKGGW